MSSEITGESHESNQAPTSECGKSASWLPFWIIIVVLGLTATAVWLYITKKMEFGLKDYQRRTEVYYVPSGQEAEIKLSRRMADRVIEIICRKPKPWAKREAKANPRGTLIVGDQSYDYYGFLVVEFDKNWGHSWHDKALSAFWDELDRVGQNFDLLADFEPRRW